MILKFSIYELFRNLSSLADWLSAIGTVSAVIVALYQIRNDKRQDLIDNRPEIMLNIKSMVYILGIIEKIMIYHVILLSWETSVKK